MARATKKRKATGGRVVASKTDGESLVISPLSRAASKDDRDSWEGWCEIESEPAFFNHILKEWGVKGTCLREVWSLEPEALSILPQPVHGIVFLFRYHDEDATIDDGDAVTAANVWFATQRVRNSCASVALMNLIMNVPGLELGGLMMHWKEFTRNVSPLARGQLLGEFKAVRQTHNTWARKIDMMAQDWHLMQNFEKRQYQAKRLQNRTKPGRNPPRQAHVEEGEQTRPGSQSDLTDLEAGFHFVSYVPVDDEIWKLDGMNDQPVKINQYAGGHKGGGDHSWLNVVADTIQARMCQFEGEGIEYAVMAFTKDPLASAREGMTQAIAGLHAIEKKLDEVDTGWRTLCEPDMVSLTNREPSNNLQISNGEQDTRPHTIDTADLEYLDYGITPADVRNAPLPEHVASAIAQLGAPHTPPDSVETTPTKNTATETTDSNDVLVTDAASQDVKDNIPSSKDPPINGNKSPGRDNARHKIAVAALQSLRDSLLETLASHRGAYRDELITCSDEALRVEQRKKDHLPMIRKWIHWLADVDCEDENGKATGQSMLEILAKRYQR